MRTHEFVEAVYAAVYRTAIDGVIRLLAQPPGQHPSPVLSEISNWYNSLDENERDRVREIVRLSVDQAVFGMLASLDGSRSLGQNSELSLGADGKDLTADHDLHDLFRELVDQELGYD